MASQALRANTAPMANQAPIASQAPMAKHAPVVAQPVAGAAAGAAVDLPFKGQAAKTLQAIPAQNAVSTRQAPRKVTPTKVSTGARKAASHMTGQATKISAAPQAKALRWHTIRPGETLIQLARQYYQGAGGHWKGIFAINRSRLKSADRVFPGDQILIPGLAEAVAAERGQVPYVTANAVPPRAGRGGERVKRMGPWRHKTRIAHRDPILKPKPGVPI